MKPLTPALCWANNGSVELQSKTAVNRRGVSAKHVLARLQFHLCSSSARRARVHSGSVLHAPWRLGRGLLWSVEKLGSCR